MTRRVVKKIRAAGTVHGYARDRTQSPEPGDKSGLLEDLGVRRFRSRRKDITEAVLDEYEGRHR